ncbi:hypothetical protein [Alteromonas sp. OM2203]|uniref:hypothetical protein n=1 Tax=Alteromonas sp. OM2203 TaxID=3398817 RepID=UPI003AF356D8
MKTRIIATLLAFGLLTHAKVTESILSIDSVGVSRNTNSIFIETKESIPQTNCSVKKLLRVNLSDPAASHILSIAIAAQSQEKQITVIYENNECMASGTAIRALKVFSDK